MSQPWSDDELKAAIKAYLEMLNLERKGEDYVKIDYYNSLSNKYERSPSAFEYRMQNISHILDAQGRQWLEGLKPAQNVGAKVTARIEKILSDVEGKVLEASASFKAEVRNIQSKVGNEPPKGKKQPKSTKYKTTHYERDPHIVAWVLNQADGFCECCENPAPFKKGDGTPYLEVHHLQTLADGGEDTIKNTIAVCPNCHRELHFGMGKNKLAKFLGDKIERLEINL